MFRATIIASLCLALACCSRRDSPSAAIMEEGVPVEAKPPPAADNVPKAAGVISGENSSDELKNPSEGYNEASSPEQDKVRLTVRVPKVVAAGSPLPIQGQIINNDEHSLFIYWETQDPMEFKIQFDVQGWSAGSLHSIWEKGDQPDRSARPTE